MKWNCDIKPTKIVPIFTKYDTKMNNLRRDLTNFQSIWPKLD